MLSKAGWWLVEQRGGGLAFGPAGRELTRQTVEQSHVALAGRVAAAPEGAGGVQVQAGGAPAQGVIDGVGGKPGVAAVQIEAVAGERPVPSALACRSKAEALDSTRLRCDA
ncbi:hypothetical protein THSYN_10870 [Candidatus Thiodictyon syntrophicum]|jgi:hypothetical protein|uniref:Uncharacterized protein n=1 Tax=Candidatus Thiodictyon syntrophicum TaxID=1166950 RepID=A0A2K8U782_9GAMM|nr:hypothetical protein THSYN_10870 [Candidatus Thiodictyon syntrophicum]